jgi:hypothetical protein
LIYYTGSHRFPCLSAESLGFTPQHIDGQTHPQKLFQQEWENLLSNSNLEKTAFLPQCSEALIWHANLLHGGDTVQSREISRWSQVTHYYFKGCIYTTPVFSFSRQHGGATLRNPYNVVSGSNIYRDDEWKHIQSLQSFGS